MTGDEHSTQEDAGQRKRWIDLQPTEVGRRPDAEASPPPHPVPDGQLAVDAPATDDAGEYRPTLGAGSDPVDPARTPAPKPAWPGGGRAALKSAEDFTSLEQLLSRAQASGTQVFAALSVHLDLAGGWLSDDGTFLVAKSASRSSKRSPNRINRKGRWYVIHTSTWQLVSDSDGEPSKSRAQALAEAYLAATDSSGQRARWADLSNSAALRAAMHSVAASVEQRLIQQGQERADAADRKHAAHRSAPGAFATRRDMVDYWAAGGSAEDPRQIEFMRHAGTAEPDTLHLSADGQFTIRSFGNFYQLVAARDGRRLSRLEFSSRTRAEECATRLAAIRGIDGEPFPWAATPLNDQMLRSFRSDRGENFITAVLRAYAETHPDGKGVPEHNRREFQIAQDAAHNAGAGPGHKFAEHLTPDDLLHGEPLPIPINTITQDGERVLVHLATGEVRKCDPREPVKIFTGDVDHAFTATFHDGFPAHRIHPAQAHSGDVVEFTAPEAHLSSQLASLDDGLGHWNGRGTWRVVGTVDSEHIPGRRPGGNGLQLTGVRIWRRQGSTWQEYPPARRTLWLEPDQTPETLLRRGGAAGTATPAADSATSTPPAPAAWAAELSPAQRTPADTEHPRRFADPPAAARHLTGIGGPSAQALDLQRGKLTEAGGFIVAKAVMKLGPFTRKNHWYVIHTATGISMTSRDGHPSRAEALAVAHAIEAHTPGADGRPLRWDRLASTDAVSAAAADTDWDLHDIVRAATAAYRQTQIHKAQAQTQARREEARAARTGNPGKGINTFRDRERLLTYYRSGGDPALSPERRDFIRTLAGEDDAPAEIHLSADGQFALIHLPPADSWRVIPAGCAADISVQRTDLGTYPSREQAEAFTTALAALRAVDGSPLDWADPELEQWAEHWRASDGQALRYHLARVAAALKDPQPEATALWQRLEAEAENHGAGRGYIFGRDLAPGAVLWGDTGIPGTVLNSRPEARHGVFGTMVRLSSGQEEFFSNTRRLLLGADQDPTVRDSSGRVVGERVYPLQPEPGDRIQFLAGAAFMTEWEINALGGVPEHVHTVRVRGRITRPTSEGWHLAEARIWNVPDIRVDAVAEELTGPDHATVVVPSFAITGPSQLLRLVPNAPDPQHTTLDEAAEADMLRPLEDLRAGDYLTAHVWTSSDWPVAVAAADKVAVTGVVHPDRGPSRSNEVRLMHASITAADGTELASDVDLPVRLPERVRIDPDRHRPDLASEEIKVAQLRIGDLLAVGPRGEVIVDLQDAHAPEGATTFSTVDIASRARRTHSLLRAREVLAVPRDRRRAEDLAQLFGRHATRAEAHLALESVHYQLDRFDRHVSEKWPGGDAPQQVQRLLSAARQVTTRPAGTSGWLASAEVLQTVALAAEEAWHEWNPPSQVPSTFGGMLFNLRHQMDLQARRARADADHVSAVKARDEEARAATSQDPQRTTETPAQAGGTIPMAEGATRALNDNEPSAASAPRQGPGPDAPGTPVPSGETAPSPRHSGVELVDREHLRGGDAISVQLSRREMEWPAETRELTKPESATIRGNLAPALTDDVFMGVDASARLLDATLRDTITGAELATGVDVLIRLPQTVTRVPTARRDDWRCEQAAAAELKVGDLVVYEGHGQSITRIEHGSQTRTYYTRHHRSQQKMAFAWVDDKDVWRVPRERRHEADLAGLLDRHADTGEAQRALSAISAELEELAAAATEQWPEADQPEHLRTITTVLADVEPHPRGSAWAANAARVEQSAAAAAALWLALDADTLHQSKFGKRLHQLRQSLETQAPKLRADAAAVAARRSSRNDHQQSPAAPDPARAPEAQPNTVPVRVEDAAHSRRNDAHDGSAAAAAVAPAPPGPSPEPRSPRDDAFNPLTAELADPPKRASFVQLAEAKAATAGSFTRYTRLVGGRYLVTKPSRHSRKITVHEVVSGRRVEEQTLPTIERGIWAAESLLAAEDYEDARHLAGANSPGPYGKVTTAAGKSAALAELAQARQRLEDAWSAWSASPARSRLGSSRSGRKLSRALEDTWRERTTGEKLTINRRVGLHLALYRAARGALTDLQPGEPGYEQLQHVAQLAGWDAHRCQSTIEAAQAAERAEKAQQERANAVTTPAAPATAPAMPADADPVEGAEGYHYTSSGREVYIYGPDGTCIAHGARTSHGTEGTVDGIRIAAPRYGGVTFPMLAAWQHRATQLPAEQQDRVWIETVPDPRAITGHVVAVRGTEKGNPDDERATIQEGKLYFSGGKQARVSGRRWSQPTIDSNLAAVLAEFARQGRNVAIRGPARSAPPDPAEPPSPNPVSPVVLEEEPSEAFGERGEHTTHDDAGTADQPAERLTGPPEPGPPQAAAASEPPLEQDLGIPPATRQEGRIVSRPGNSSPDDADAADGRPPNGPDETAEETAESLGYIRRADHDAHVNYLKALADALATDAARHLPHRSRRARGFIGAWQDVPTTWRATTELHEALDASEKLADYIGRSPLLPQSRLIEDLQLLAESTTRHLERVAASPESPESGPVWLARGPLAEIEPYRTPEQMRSALTTIRGTWQELYRASRTARTRPEVEAIADHRRLLLDINTAYGITRSTLPTLLLDVEQYTAVYEATARLGDRQTHLAEPARLVGTAVRQHAERLLATGRDNAMLLERLQQIEREERLAGLPAAELMDPAAIRADIQDLTSSRGLSTLLDRLPVDHPARLGLRKFVSRWSVDHAPTDEWLDASLETQPYYYRMSLLERLCADVRAVAPTNADLAPLGRLEKHIGAADVLLSNPSRAPFRGTYAALTQAAEQDTTLRQRLAAAGEGPELWQTITEWALGNLPSDTPDVVRDIVADLPSSIDPGAQALGRLAQRFRSPAVTSATQPKHAAGDTVQAAGASATIAEPTTAGAATLPSTAPATLEELKEFYRLREQHADDPKMRHLYQSLAQDASMELLADSNFIRYGERGSWRLAPAGTGQSWDLLDFTNKAEAEAFADHLTTTPLDPHGAPLPWRARDLTERIPAWRSDRGEPTFLAVARTRVAFDRSRGREPHVKAQRLFEPFEDRGRNREAAPDGRVWADKAEAGTWLVLSAGTGSRQTQLEERSVLPDGTVRLRGSDGTAQELPRNTLLDRAPGIDVAAADGRLIGQRVESTELKVGDWIQLPRTAAILNQARVDLHLAYSEACQVRGRITDLHTDAATGKLSASLEAVSILHPQLPRLGHHHLATSGTSGTRRDPVRWTLDQRTPQIRVDEAIYDTLAGSPLPARAYEWAYGLSGHTDRPGLAPWMQVLNRAAELATTGPSPAGQSKAATAAIGDLSTCAGRLEVAFRDSDEAALLTELRTLNGYIDEADMPDHPVYEPLIVAATRLTSEVLLTESHLVQQRMTEAQESLRQASPFAHLSELQLHDTLEEWEDLSRPLREGESRHEEDDWPYAASDKRCNEAHVLLNHNGSRGQASRAKGLAEYDRNAARELREAGFRPVRGARGVTWLLDSRLEPAERLERVTRAHAGLKALGRTVRIQHHGLPPQHDAAEPEQREQQSAAGAATGRTPPELSDDELAAEEHALLAKQVAEDFTAGDEQRFELLQRERLKRAGTPLAEDIADPQQRRRAMADRDRRQAEAEAARHEEQAARLRREADGRQQSADHAFGRFAGGQPILAGHHSAPSARRARARGDAATQTALDLRAHADEQDALARGARARAEVAGRRVQMGRLFAKADFQPGDIVEYTWRHQRVERSVVRRANAKTVTMEAPAEGFDAPKVPYERVVGRIRDGVLVRDPASLDSDAAPSSNAQPPARATDAALQSPPSEVAPAAAAASQANADVTGVTTPPAGVHPSDTHRSASPFSTTGQLITHFTAAPMPHLPPKSDGRKALQQLAKRKSFELTPNGLFAMVQTDDRTWSLLAAGSGLQPGGVDHYAYLLNSGLETTLDVMGSLPSREDALSFADRLAAIRDHLDSPIDWANTALPGHLGGFRFELDRLVLQGRAAFDRERGRSETSDACVVWDLMAIRPKRPPAPEGQVYLDELETDELVWFDEGDGGELPQQLLARSDGPAGLVTVRLAPLKVTSDHELVVDHDASHEWDVPRNLLLPRVTEEEIRAEADTLTVREPSTAAAAAVPSADAGNPNTDPAQTSQADTTPETHELSLRREPEAATLFDTDEETPQHASAEPREDAADASQHPHAIATDPGPTRSATNAHDGSPAIPLTLAHTTAPTAGPDHPEPPSTEPRTASAGHGNVSHAGALTASPKDTDHRTPDQAGRTPPPRFSDLEAVRRRLQSVANEVAPDDALERQVWRATHAQRMHDAKELLDDNHLQLSRSGRLLIHRTTNHNDQTRYEVYTPGSITELTSHHVTVPTEEQAHQLADALELLRARDATPVPWDADDFKHHHSHVRTHLDRPLPHAILALTERVLGPTAAEDLADKHGWFTDVWRAQQAFAHAGYTVPVHRRYDDVRSGDEIIASGRIPADPTNEGPVAGDGPVPTLEGADQPPGPDTGPLIISGRVVHLPTTGHGDSVVLQDVTWAAKDGTQGSGPGPLLIVQGAMSRHLRPGEDEGNAEVPVLHPAEVRTIPIPEPSHLSMAPQAEIRPVAPRAISDTSQLREYYRTVWLQQLSANERLELMEIAVNPTLRLDTSGQFAAVSRDARTWDLLPASTAFPGIADLTGGFSSLAEAETFVARLNATYPELADAWGAPGLQKRLIDWHEARQHRSIDEEIQDLRSRVQRTGTSVEGLNQTSDTSSIPLDQSVGTQRGTTAGSADFGQNELTVADHSPVTLFEPQDSEAGTTPARPTEKAQSIQVAPSSPPKTSKPPQEPAMAQAPTEMLPLAESGAPVPNQVDDPLPEGSALSPNVRTAVDGFMTDMIAAGRTALYDDECTKAVTAWLLDNASSGSGTGQGWQEEFFRDADNQDRLIQDVTRAARARLHSIPATSGAESHRSPSSTPPTTNARTADTQVRASTEPAAAEKTQSRSGNETPPLPVRATEPPEAAQLPFVRRSDALAARGLVQEAMQDLQRTASWRRLMRGPSAGKRDSRRPEIKAMAAAWSMPHSDDLSGPQQQEVDWARTVAQAAHHLLDSRVSKSREFEQRLQILVESAERFAGRLAATAGTSDGWQQAIGTPSSPTQAGPANEANSDRQGPAPISPVSLPWNEQKIRKLVAMGKTIAEADPVRRVPEGQYAENRRHVISRLDDPATRDLVDQHAELLAHTMQDLGNQAKATVQDASKVPSDLPALVAELRHTREYPEHRDQHARQAVAAVLSAVDAATHAAQATHADPTVVQHAMLQLTGMKALTMIDGQVYPDVHDAIAPVLQAKDDMLQRLDTTGAATTSSPPSGPPSAATPVTPAPETSADAPAPPASASSTSPAAIGEPAPAASTREDPRKAFASPPQPKPRPSPSSAARHETSSAQTPAITTSPAPPPSPESDALFGRDALSIPTSGLPPSPAASPSPPRRRTTLQASDAAAPLPPGDHAPRAEHSPLRAAAADGSTPSVPSPAPREQHGGNSRRAPRSTPVNPGNVNMNDLVWAEGHGPNGRPEIHMGFVAGRAPDPNRPGWLLLALTDQPGAVAGDELFVSTHENSHAVALPMHAKVMRVDGVPRPLSRSQVDKAAAELAASASSDASLIRSVQESDEAAYSQAFRQWLWQHAKDLPMTHKVNRILFSDPSIDGNPGHRAELLALAASRSHERITTASQSAPTALPATVTAPPRSTEQEQPVRTDASHGNFPTLVSTETRSPELPNIELGGMQNEKENAGRESRQINQVQQAGDQTNQRSAEESSPPVQESTGTAERATPREQSIPAVRERYSAVLSDAVDSTLLQDVARRGRLPFGPAFSGWLNRFVDGVRESNPGRPLPSMLRELTSDAALRDAVAEEAFRNIREARAADASKANTQEATLALFTDAPPERGNRPPAVKALTPVAPLGSDPLDDTLEAGFDALRADLYMPLMQNDKAPDAAAGVAAAEGARFDAVREELREAWDAACGPRTLRATGRPRQGHVADRDVEAALAAVDDAVGADHEHPEYQAMHRVRAATYDLGKVLAEDLSQQVIQGLELAELDVRRRARAQWLRRAVAVKSCAAISVSADGMADLLASSEPAPGRAGLIIGLRKLADVTDRYAAQRERAVRQQGRLLSAVTRYWSASGRKAAAQRVTNAFTAWQSTTMGGQVLHKHPAAASLRAAWEDLPDSASPASIQAVRQYLSLAQNVNSVLILAEQSDRFDRKDMRAMQSLGETAGRHACRMMSELRGPEAAKEVAVLASRSATRHQTSPNPTAARPVAAAGHRRPAAGLTRRSPARAA